MTTDAPEVTDARTARSASRMTIDLLDYSGHPCQIQLSRALAGRQHAVRHLYCPDYTSGKGAVDRRYDDAETFEVSPISLGEEFDRYRVSSRLKQEVRFGMAAAQTIETRRPDVTVICNVPLLAHAILTARLRRAGIPMLFWQQDVYSHAINATASRRLGVAGRLIGALADRVERGIARRSESVVAISNSFTPTLQRWGIDADRYEVIHNWAPLDEMPSNPKINDWSTAHDLDGRFVMLYSGTLGLKHDPSVLLTLARTMAANDPEARVVVVSQGAGRAWLEENAIDLPQLVLLDYQPYEELANVLASADVFLVLLEPEAGVFSVPSKTLNYLCAGRPTLAVMPATNAAAQTLVEIDGGVVVHPGDVAGLESAGLRLLRDEATRARMGLNARAYAEATFNVDLVADKFEARLRSAIVSAK